MAGGYIKKESKMRTDSTSVRPLTFFVLTFILSWLIWIPLALSHFGIGPLHIPEGTIALVRLLGVLMPATAALILTALKGGRPALRSMLSHLFIWRTGWRWWAAAALLMPAVLGLSALIYNAVWGDPPVIPLPQTSASALIINVIMLLIATLGEEIGWRGLALPSLQQRYTPLRSSIILGFLWSSWHIPFWLLLDTYTQFGIPYLVLNFLLIVPLTGYITWFYNNGRSSLLLVVAFHVFFNIVNVALLPVTINTGAFAIFIAFDWVIALLVLPRLVAVNKPALKQAKS
jgi:uncharacterized protein